MDSKPMKLTTFRKLLRRKLQQDNESRKSALHTLIERITAYPDRKMEVKFRIGEKVEGTHGGQDLYPHESQLPYGLEKRSILPSQRTGSISSLFNLAT